jgi:hypothetical protein
MFLFAIECHCLCVEGSAEVAEDAVEQGRRGRSGGGNLRRGRRGRSGGGNLRSRKFLVNLKF